MALDRSLLNRLLSCEYTGRGTTPAPVREELHRFRRKESLGGDVAERFHENTKLTGREARAEARTRAAFRENETLQFARRRAPPDYRGSASVSLPPPAESLQTDVTAAVARQRGWNAAGDALSRQRLSTLLHYACGTPRGTPNRSDAEPGDRRAYPSCSGAYPIEPYVAVVNGDERLDRGLYAYVPEGHALRRIEQDEDFAETVAESFVGDRIDVRDAAVCLVLTGAFWRAKARYGPRGYRLALHEAGHAMQNLRLVASAMGLSAVPCASVREERLESALGVNGVDESVVYAGAVGVPREADR